MELGGALDMAPGLIWGSKIGRFSPCFRGMAGMERCIVSLPVHLCKLLDLRVNPEIVQIALSDVIKMPSYIRA